MSFNSKETNTILPPITSVFIKTGPQWPCAVDLMSKSKNKGPTVFRKIKSNQPLYWNSHIFTVQCRTTILIPYGKLLVCVLAISYIHIYKTWSNIYLAFGFSGMLHPYRWYYYNYYRTQTLAFTENSGTYWEQWQVSI